jgi:tetratricopeptide (TPR) repeat protein
MELDPQLCDLIKRKIAGFEPGELLEAVRLTESFPPPGSEPADVVAQVLHDVALHAESLGDWSLCLSLYSRSLEYTVDGPRIHVGSWFRCGLCQERMGLLRDAMDSYRKALSYGEVWPHVTALARKHLAELLMAADEFQEALAFLEQLSRALPHPEISREEVEVNLARCLLRLQRREEARVRLEELCTGPAPTEAALEGLKLLADVYEASRDWQSAIACYRRIIESGAAEAGLKAAAAFRLAALQDLI